MTTEPNAPRSAHRLLRRLLTLTATVLAVATPADAEPGAGRWTVRAVGVWAETSESYTAPADAEEEIDVAVDGAPGAGLFVEARLGRRLGLELGVLTAALDTEVSLESPAIGRQVASDELTVRPITLGLPIHLTPDGSGPGGIDLVLTPLVAYVQYGDLAFDFDALAFHPRFSFDDELTWGAALGVDRPLGSRGWSLTASLRWLAAEADGGEEARVTLDPLLVALGAGYTF